MARSIEEWRDIGAELAVTHSEAQAELFLGFSEIISVEGWGEEQLAYIAVDVVESGDGAEVLEVLKSLVYFLESQM